MLNNIRDLIHSIINLGVDPKRNSIHQFHTKLLNFVILVEVAVLVVAFPIAGFDSDFVFYLPIIGMLFCVLVGLYLNSIKKYDLAKITLIIILPTIQFINLIFVDTKSAGIESTFLPLGMLALVIFRNRWTKLLSVGYVMTLFVVVFVARDYNLDRFYWYSPLVVLIGVLIGVNILVSYLQDTAEELITNNEQLNNQNIKLEKLVVQNELKTELLGILSHDLKGPASAFNQLSKKVSFLLKHERYDELEEFSNYFEVAGDKIYHDIDRLLNWTIAQKKDIITRIEEIFPHRLFNTLVDGLKYQVSDKDVVFINNISKDISLNTDKHILDIILKNLLVNAANHCEDGKEVTIDYSDSHIYHVISINNSGTPINMDIVAEAKVGRYRKSKDGHGLGLGICYSLIMFLNGEITFESDSVRGTTAFVEFLKDSEVIAGVN